jgi:hypothetical protein
MLVCAAIFAGFCARADGPVLVPGLLMWSGLFGALGWNFVDLSSGHGNVGRPGLLVSWVVFWAMAAGGLLPLLGLGLGWIRRGGKPEVPVDKFPMGPVVRASAPRVAPTPGPLQARAAAAAGPIVPARIVRPPSAAP